jgi:hypothetical protein
MTCVLLDTVRAGLRELADIEFQRRVWTGRGGADEMSSFEEAVETLFDDSGVEPNLGLGRPVFGPPLDAKMLALGELLDRIEADRSPDEIIDDPLMVDVRRAAAAILEALPGWRSDSSSG